MSTQDKQYTMLPNASLKALAIALGVALGLAMPIQAAAPTHKKTVTKPATIKQLAPSAQPASVSTGGPIEFASQISATVGKSTLLRLPEPASRISVGSPEIADVILLNPSEIYLLGKKVGSTNIILWSKTGQSTIVDVAVGMDTASLQNKLAQLLPNDKNVKIYAAADTVVLSGSVSDAVKVDRAVALAEAFAGKKVVNMLSVSSVQQVMLEVKIAEINRTELDKLGLNFTWQNGANFLYGIIGGNSGIYSRLGGAASVASDGTIGAANPGIFGSSSGNIGTVGISSNNHTSGLIDAKNNDSLVKILAEPNIVAISGQEGSFLAGGEILIPVPQSNGTISLESKQFGVGLRFTPTVLDQGHIQMRVQPEVTDLVGFTNVATSGLGASTLVPTLTTRRVSTTVELREGQSLAIGGLLQDGTRSSINRFPLLGDIPILGALFRSTEYQKDKTELLIVVTPRLVKPLDANYTLPTDAYKEPTKKELFLDGKLEGKTASEPATAPKPDAQPQTPAPSGFQMK
ncbi:MAG: type II and III secretion system protein family protein [Formivibrio sp.]|nr:type II and III secretion system protein family protein [Formivibrio sp.]